MKLTTCVMILTKLVLKEYGLRYERLLFIMVTVVMQKLGNDFHYGLSSFQTFFCFCNFIHCTKNEIFHWEFLPQMWKLHFLCDTFCIWVCWGKHFSIFNQNKFTAQEIKFSIKVFFSKCDQIRRILLVCSHLLKKFSIKNFIFSAVISCLS